MFKPNRNSYNWPFFALFLAVLLVGPPQAEAKWKVRHLAFACKNLFDDAIYFPRLQNWYFSHNNPYVFARSSETARRYYLRSMARDLRYKLDGDFARRRDRVDYLEDRLGLRLLSTAPRGYRAITVAPQIIRILTPESLQDERTGKSVKSIFESLIYLAGFHPIAGFACPFSKSKWHYVEPSAIFAVADIVRALHARSALNVLGEQRRLWSGLAVHDFSQMLKPGYLKPSATRDLQTIQIAVLALLPALLNTDFVPEPPVRRTVWRDALVTLREIIGDSRTSKVVRTAATEAYKQLTLIETWAK